MLISVVEGLVQQSRGIQFGAIFQLMVLQSRHSVNVFKVTILISIYMLIFYIIKWKIHVSY